jgi:hypothetical protein
MTVCRDGQPLGMTPRIEGIMTAQHGLITRRQALAVGLAPEAIDRATRRGSWVIVRRGVYTTRELWQSLTRVEDVQLTRDRAASLRIGRPHVMSHDSAALELGLAILRAEPRLTHVTRPGVVGSHLRHGVKHHLAPYLLSQVVVAHGRPVLGPARTAADIAREHAVVPGVVASTRPCAPAPNRSKSSGPSRRCRTGQGVTVARAAWDAADPGADSVGETLSRLLVEALGHGRPDTQFGLTDGTRTAWCDLRLGRQVYEFDGAAKYRRIEDGGLAKVDPADVLWYEKQRQDWVCGFKLGMSRLVWDDVFGPRRRRTLRRLEREYLDTVARFGTSIDDLAPYLARRPRRRAA